MRGWMGKARETDAATLFADRPLARRIEAAWDRLGVENAVTLRMRAPRSGAEVLAVGGGHAVFMGPGSPLSQAQGLGLCEPVREDELQRMQDFFHDRETPTQVEVASLADPALLTALSRRGFLIVEQSHALACPLGGWRAGTSRRGRPHGEVEVVRVGEDELEHWVDVVLGCFFEGPEPPPPALRDGALAMALVPGTTAWLARVDGRPAGGGSLVVRNGLALICGDGTLGEFRQLGVQTALLEARLAHAVDQECDLATICTQPGSGSQRNAERQGFRVVYARTMMVHA